MCSKTVLSSGRLLTSKLINLAVPGTILPDAINLYESKQMSIFKKRENLNLAIFSAKSIGCVTTNITCQSLIQKRQHIMLGLVWQAIQIQLLNRIQLRRVPEIMVLKLQNEEDQDMKKLSSKNVLLRWLNFHLKNNKFDKEVKNFHKDLQDLDAYLSVFNDISKLDQKAFTYGVQKRAQHILDLSIRQGISSFITVDDLVQSRQKLNIMFCAQIFNCKHGIILDERRKPVFVQQIDDNDQRQIRIYKTWINSMGLQSGTVVSLLEDLKDGLILLKLIEYMKPRSVDWQKAYKSKLSNRIYRIQNCNYAVELVSKQFQVKVVGFSGTQIVDGKVFADLGILWQLYRIESFAMIGKMNQQSLIAWANPKVGTYIKGLRDKSLQDSMYWLKLINSIDDRVVNFATVKQKGQDGYLQFNAKYTLSSARKLGAQVIILWEHISQVNSKFLLIFLASLYQVQSQRKKR